MNKGIINMTIMKSCGCFLFFAFFVVSSSNVNAFTTSSTTTMAPLFLRKQQQQQQQQQRHHRTADVSSRSRWIIAAAAASSDDNSTCNTNTMQLERRPSAQEAAEAVVSETSDNSVLRSEKQQQQQSLSMTSDDSTTTTSLSNDVSVDGNPDDVDVAGAMFWRGVVVALCALWASNFAVAKLVMAEPGVDSSLYALARFGVAALALLPGAWAQRSTLDVATAKGAAICGAWVAFGYLGQTLALLTTTASRSCVICTLHCVFVAIVAETMRVSRAAAVRVLDSTNGTNEPDTNDSTTVATTNFDVMRLVPAAVAVAGVAIVELKGAGGTPTIGDALSFAQPIGFGLGYLQLEELMRQKPEAALPVSAIKLMVVALASLGMYELSPFVLQGSGTAGSEIGSVAAAAASVLTLPDFGPILSSPTALRGILYTGLITTALALWVESIAFKRVPATDASIILTTEPLFAAAAGAFALGETFGVSDYVGATLIIGACALAVLLDDEASDDKCEIDDAMQGKCEPQRTLPISAD